MGVGRLMVSTDNSPRESMSSPVTLERFLQKWRQALRDREPPERQFWEGRKAYSDLKKTGYLEHVRLEQRNDVVEWHVVPKICRAVKSLPATGEDCVSVQ